MAVHDDRVRTSKADALAKLRSSAGVFADALPSVTADRCATVCVTMPFGALFSLYEVGEFAVAHVHHHIGQVNRTLAASGGA